MVEEASKDKDENLVKTAHFLKALKTELELQRVEKRLKEDEALGRDGEVITFGKDSPKEDKDLK